MDTTLPQGSAPKPVPIPHFPNVLHAVVWRNWELVGPEKLSAVLMATPRQIVDIARSMGLPERPRISPHSVKRNYITIIRRNWHLLPYDQIIGLLDWTEENMRYALREDDFLYIKLGCLKPSCEPVHYSPPSEDVRRKAEAIRTIVRRHFGSALETQRELPFHFLDELTASIPMSSSPAAVQTGDGDWRSRPPAYIYSYFALYGDPLLEAETDPFPEGYLEKLAAVGVGGVWLQAVLHTLAYWSLDPKLSHRFEERLQNLGKLADRAARHGMGIYLYLNEPRSQPREFFQRHPELKGVQDRNDPDYWTLCTSVPVVREFIGGAVESVFRAVPELAGAFTITMSENLTNCHSHGYGTECPRCGKRDAAETVAEVNRVIAEGAWRANPEARVIAWDWGWRDEWAEQAIGLLPKKMWYMCVSEWTLPIERGGVKSAVGEYCMSAVGPGPRALRHWRAARKRGMKTVAKIQVNNTWEMAATPYIPVMRLLAENLMRLSQESVQGLMLGWTVGGYPSANLEIAREVWRMHSGDSSAGAAAILLEVAENRFGKRHARQIVRAWDAFSDAFQEFPFHIGVVYMGPHHAGPANLLFADPTGYRATMVGIAYDDLESWRAVYPEEIFIGQLQELARKWEIGITVLKEVLREVLGEAADHSRALGAELRIAQACLAHWRSAANQAEFVKHRGQDPIRCRELLESEIVLAKEMFDIVDTDSRIGFEATNHYFYTRLDFVEKVLNCTHLLSTDSIAGSRPESPATSRTR